MLERVSCESCRIRHLNRCPNHLFRACVLPQSNFFNFPFYVKFALEFVRGRFEMFRDVAS